VRHTAKDRNDERDLYLQRYLKEGDKEVDRLFANLEELDKDGDAVGGSLQRIETGSLFAIGLRQLWSLTIGSSASPVHRISQQNLIHGKP
jgi:hypothetical protein